MILDGLSWFGCVMLVVLCWLVLFGVCFGFVGLVWFVSFFLGAKAEAVRITRY